MSYSEIVWRFVGIKQYFMQFQYTTFWSSAEQVLNLSIYTNLETFYYTGCSLNYSRIFSNLVLHIRAAFWELTSTRLMPGLFGLALFLLQYILIYNFLYCFSCKVKYTVAFSRHRLLHSSTTHFCRKGFFFDGEWIRANFSKFAVYPLQWKLLWQA